jgi:periplasmic copper chaperone A
MKLWFASSLFALAAHAVAQPAVDVKQPWVRATVAQQSATGAFMQLTAASDLRLVAAQSPVAGVVEVHEMAMENQVMKMRAVPHLPLPAGKTVELKPGGYHVMLMDLKTQVKAGETVPLTLVFENASGQRQSLELKAPVRALDGKKSTGPTPSHGPDMHKH